MNRLTIENVKVQNGNIKYQYTVEGDWKKYFKLEKQAEVTYDINIENVPQGILVLPFICNILPMVWLCHAQIYTEVIDQDFIDNLPDVKKGYQDMYPMLDFGETTDTGIVSKVCKNINEKQTATACFFSGGVDAYTTLLRHIDEKPMILTVWGADIRLTDEQGWNRVWKHTESVATDYGLQKAVIISNFKEYIEEGRLGQLVKESKDGWWHGFQHGVGLLGHAAPLAFYYGLDTVYIAASFPESMKGQYTCASDPSIDNHVKYGGCSVVHDGYEMARQAKVKYLVSEKEKYNREIKLRVCWESSGGGNCCSCEKCYRTVLEIVSEGGNPNEYGFAWSKRNIKKCHWDMKTKIEIVKYNIDLHYPPIQKALYLNKDKIVDYKKYQWLEKMDFDKFNEFPIKKLRRTIFWRAGRKMYRIIFQRRK